MPSNRGISDRSSNSGPVVFVESNLTGYNALAVELAKARGLPTALAARNPDEYLGMKPDLLSLVDRVDLVDTYDVGKLTHYAASVEARALVAVDDYRLVPTAAAASALGLPHADVQGLVNTHFKDRARALCAGIGRAVEFTVIERETNLRSSPLGYPCVVKPLDDSGSTGVSVCQNDSDFAEALARVRQVRRNLRDYECTEGLLVEEYVPGTEYTAECMWDSVRGRWQLLGYTRKLLAPPPAPVETGAVYPYFFDETLDKAIESTVYAWLAAVGHRHGSAHVEFKVDGKNIALIEINPRLGGDQIRDLIRLAGNADPIEMYLDLALGKDVRVERTAPRQIFATSLYKLPPKPGKIMAVRAPERIDKNVIRHSLMSSPAEFDGIRDNDDRLGYVITRGASAEEAVCTAEEFMSQVEVEYVK